MKKRVLSILLAALMIVLLLPAGAVLAADPDGTEPEVISQISISGWTEPEPGGLAGDYDYAAIVSDTAHVTVVPSSLCWVWNQSEVPMKSDQTFEHGKAYYLQIDVQCDESCVFADDLTVYINGSTNLVDTDTVYVMDDDPRYAFFATKDYGIPEEGEPEYGHITVTADGSGSASADASVQFVDMTVEITAIPDSGSVFRGWQVVSGNLRVEDIETVDAAKGVYRFTMPSGDVALKAVFASVPSDPAVLQSKKGVVRLGGSDRFATANAISAEGWDKAKTVIIANAYNYADALAGAPLAYALDAPILLASGDNISSSLKSELMRLNPDNVIILGGDKAISYSLQYSIQVNGYGTERIAGQTRYETAKKIAEELKKVRGSVSEVFVASGVNYPDALSASSAAAIKYAPILYSPKNGTIDEDTLSFIGSSGVSSAYILGGEAAVGKAAETGLRGMGVSSVKRLGGDDRYETSMNIAKTFRSVYGGKAASLATGRNFPDALAGSVLAAKLRMPVLLTDNKTVRDDTKFFIADMKPEGMYIFGSYAVISDSIANVLYDYAGNYKLTAMQAEAYLSEIMSLEAKYGKSTLNKTGDGNAQFLLGLCYARLVDFDGDDNPELVCVWGEKNDRGSYSDFDYTCRIYLHHDDSGIIKAYEGGISNCGQDICPAVTLLCNNSVYNYYTVVPSGEYKYYADPEGIFETCFVVQYDEYEGVNTMVNGFRVSMDEAVDRHNAFLDGCAEDETYLFFYDIVDSTSYIPEVEQMTKDTIDKLESAA